jgi:hypothetical protein
MAHAPEQLSNMTVAECDRVVASRASAVRNAIAITRMEGGEPSAICLELLALYVAGEITGMEMRKRMLRRVRGEDQ